VKCYIISAGVWLDYLNNSLFIPIYETAVGIISPVEFAKRGFYGKIMTSQCSK